MNVLFLDIETSPIVVRVWGLKDQNISLNQIVRDWEILAWSAKWLGNKKVMYEDVRNDVTDDKILKPLWYLLDKADIVVTQNGIQFDAKKINARFILRGMKPPSPYKHFDTYQLVKRVAGFTSNKLEYLTDKLCTKYKKLKHSKFPGWELWNECLEGNTKAWNEMKRYNIRDVMALEELYLKIRAWAPDTFPSISESIESCRACQSKHLVKHSIYATLAGKWQRRKCMNCGKVQRGERIKS